MFMVIMEVDILNDDSLGKFIMSTYLSNGYTLSFLPKECLVVGPCSTHLKFQIWEAEAGGLAAQ